MDVRNRHYRDHADAVILSHGPGKLEKLQSLGKGDILDELTFGERSELRVLALAFLDKGSVFSEFGSQFVPFRIDADLA